MRNIILISILAIGLFQTRAALADANLCNSGQHTIWADYGEQTFHEDYWNGTSYTTAWISGWFQTDPGHCSKPEIGDVCFWWAYFWNNCPDAVLFFADDAFGDQWGGGGRRTATTLLGTRFVPRIMHSPRVLKNSGKMGIVHPTALGGSGAERG